MIEVQDASKLAENALRRAADIVAAYVGNNSLPAGELAALIRSVHGVLESLSGNAAAEASTPKPAVSVKRSVTDAYLICLEDGKKLKMLKRYLRSHYGLSPDEYRTKWGLPRDYPMVAPNYAELRSAFAKEIGLGKKPHKRGRR